MFFACIFAALLQVFVMTFLASQIMQDGVTLAKLVSTLSPELRATSPGNVSCGYAL